LFAGWGVNSGGGDVIRRRQKARRRVSQVVTVPQIIGQDLHGQVFLAAQLADAQSQVGGDLSLRELLGITMEQNVVDAPGMGLEWHIRPRLEGLNGFHDNGMQSREWIIMLVEVEHLKKRTFAQLGRIVEMPQRPLDGLYE